jgi:hypothetical protein
MHTALSCGNYFQSPQIAQIHLYSQVGVLANRFILPFFRKPSHTLACRFHSNHQSNSKAIRKSGVEINNSVENCTNCRIACTRSSRRKEAILVIMGAAPWSLM